MISKFIPPSYDIVFKAIFGKESNKPLLASLLSSVLNLPLDELLNLEILNSELGVSHIDEKNSRLDLRLRLQSGIEIDVEIQIIQHNAYIERILSYWAKLYLGNLTTGLDYSNLRKCVIVNIIGFNYFDWHELHSKFKICSEKNGSPLTDLLEIHFIELLKLDQYNKDIENPILCDWVEFLGLKNEVDMEKFRDKSDLPEQIIQAIEELEKLKKDPNMQMEAFNKELFIRDYFQGLNDAMKAGHDEGTAVGLAKGKAEGLAVGLAEGKAEGLAKGKYEATLAIAKAMLVDGLSPEVIAKFTGLSVQEINQL